MSKSVTYFYQALDNDVKRSQQPSRNGKKIEKTPSRMRESKEEELSVSARKSRNEKNPA